MIALDGRSAAAAPLTGQVEVVRALAADVTLAHMVLYPVSQSHAIHPVDLVIFGHLHRAVRPLHTVRRSSTTGMSESRRRRSASQERPGSSAAPIAAAAGPGHLSRQGQTSLRVESLGNFLGLALRWLLPRGRS